MPRRKTEMQSIWPSTSRQTRHLADGSARLVEVEEDLTLRVERRLRRVDVFGAGLVAGFQRARREGDHPAALVGDGKHDPLAETVVDGALAAVALFLRAEEAAGAEGLVVGHAAEPVAQGVEAVRRVADAEGLDAFGSEAAAGEIFAGDGAFGRAQLLFKPGV
jgi:hypothetical protein